MFSGRSNDSGNTPKNGKYRMLRTNVNSNQGSACRYREHSSADRARRRVRMLGLQLVDPLLQILEVQSAHPVGEGQLYVPCIVLDMADIGLHASDVAFQPVEAGIHLREPLVHPVEPNLYHAGHLVRRDLLLAGRSVLP